MDMVSFFGAGLIAFTLCIFFIVMGMPLARHIGLVDKPQGRKQHEGTIPLIGGLVIIPVYLGMLFFFPDYHDLPLLKFVPAVAVLLAVGALDDRMHIHPWVRFGIQVIVALYSVIIFDNLNSNLGNLFGFGNVGLGWFKYIFFATCLVLLMNAINMIDGVDGLSGGLLTTVTLFLIAVVGVKSGLFFPLFLLLCCLLAFLVFNLRTPLRKKASVFIGDAGSLSLALLIGWLAIEASNDNLIEPISIAWLLAVPIIDTFALFFIRVKNGVSPFQGDRLHLHFKLIDGGLPPGIVAFTLIVMATVAGAIGYAATMSSLPTFVFFYSWAGLLLGYTFYRLKKG